MDEVLHPVKSRRLIEGPAQHAYDFIQSVIDGSGQAVVDRVALAVVRAGVRVLVMVSLFSEWSYVGRACRIRDHRDQ